jgi:hypothetical protein
MYSYHWAQDSFQWLTVCKRSNGRSDSVKRFAFLDVSISEAVSYLVRW